MFSHNQTTSATITSHQTLWWCYGIEHPKVLNERNVNNHQWTGILTGGSLFGMYGVDQNGHEKMYYIYTDHLGSPNLITDAECNVVQELSYIGDIVLCFDVNWGPLGDGKDRYRTGGLLLSYQINKDITLAFGGSMITGDGEGDALDVGNETINPETGEPAGTWNPANEIMTKLRGGIMYGGVVYKGNSYFIGNNAEKRLHTVQNYIHDRVGTPYFFNHNLGFRSFGYYGSFHRNYLNY